jgi:hypothetical protein
MATAHSSCQVISPVNIEQVAADQISLTGGGRFHPPRLKPVIRLFEYLIQYAPDQLACAPEENLSITVDLIPASITRFGEAFPGFLHGGECV